MEIIQDLIDLLQALMLLLIVIWLIHTNKRIDSAKDQEPIKTPSKPLFKAKPKPTDEEIKYEKILANIDAYDGSGKGQTKV